MGQLVVVDGEFERSLIQGVPAAAVAAVGGVARISVVAMGATGTLLIPAERFLPVLAAVPWTAYGWWRAY